ncbi:unnamed protein product [Brachionus calyciflorus]|uniref:Ig-like domain-containing protein n=1 Tax=Brachionus calyciflorus TaxID=104777 RepID=A0A814AAN5_9BILA|nr:unnamed protein product [Brachionus calyciflorus]
MNFLLKAAILTICLANFIYTEDAKIVKVKFNYKQKTTLDCSEFENAEYWKEITVDGNKTEVQISDNDKHVSFDDNKKLVLNDLRAEHIRHSNYFCKAFGKKVVTFEKQVGPFISKPEKVSQTVTEGGNVEIKCAALYGDESLTWVWTKNGTEIKPDDRYSIVNTENTTTLTFKNVQQDDKGEYECELRNDYGEHKEIIKIRVKDALAALWPFLAIVAEVVILCLIILIYEKKCSKKPNSNEEENEQAQNLMGKDNADLKKRTTKA